MALGIRGYASQQQLATDIGLVRSTVNNFLNGKPVEHLNFLEICEKLGLDWQKICVKEDIPPDSPDEPDEPEEPSTSVSEQLGVNSQFFIGRETLIENLINQLQQQTRILIITGITGQGKTALSQEIANQIQNVYRPLIPITFDNTNLLDSAGNLSDFASIYTHFLDKMGVKYNDNDRQDLTRLRNLLTEKLCETPYLLRIESLETMLKGETKHNFTYNYFVDPTWEEFLKLFLQNTCKSRIILTSQYLPCFRVIRESEYHSEPSYYVHRLQGLTYQKYDTPQVPTGENGEIESELLFRKRFEKSGKTLDPNHLGYIHLMSKCYEGHPLILELIVGEILSENECYQGDIKAYWQDYQREFTPNSHADSLANQLLEDKVRNRVKLSLSRLQEDIFPAFVLLCFSSIYRVAVPENMIYAILENSSKSEKIAALKTLVNRSLIMAEGTGKNILYRQHNLIRSTAEQFLKETDLWESAHQLAIKFWLEQYQPPDNCNNLEKVQGYLEAFYHYCELGDWQSAYYNILGTKIDGEDLDNKLGTWGYYGEQFAIYKRLLQFSSLTDECKGDCYRGLGTVYHSQGKYEDAIACYQQYLTIARELGNRSGEGGALGNLGNVYYSQGKYEDAIACHQQHLTIARELGNPSGEGMALGNLGLVYQSQGKYEDAIACYQQHLTIARELGNRSGEGTALGNLGTVYHSQGKYEDAIAFYQQDLTIARELGNRSGEGTALGNLGTVY
ncbi:MAG: hypothetical protein RLZZ338_3425, partial [Cyanobacteriota bacterium]